MKNNSTQREGQLLSYAASGNVVLIVSLVFLALFIYSSIVRPLVESITGLLPRIPGGLGVKTAFMMLFSGFHAVYTLGWRHAMVLFALTFLISWAYEQVGVETGFIYGRYHYTDALGTKLGHVPIIIPVAWFMMIYPSYIIANLIAYGNPRRIGNYNYNSNPIANASNTDITCRKQSLIQQIIWLPLLSALVMTAWDLVVDPYLSGPTQRVWIWEDGGSEGIPSYFGVPLQNFGGWILTTFTIYIVWLLLNNKIHDHSLGPINAPVLMMPIMAYGLMMIANIIPRDPPDLLIIGPIVMGIPVAIAGYSILSHRSNAENTANMSSREAQQ